MCLFCCIPLHPMQPRSPLWKSLDIPLGSSLPYTRLPQCAEDLKIATPNAGFGWYRYEGWRSATHFMDEQMGTWMDGVQLHKLFFLRPMDLVYGYGQVFSKKLIQCPGNRKQCMVLIQKHCSLWLTVLQAGFLTLSHPSPSWWTVQLLGNDTANAFASLVASFALQHHEPIRGSMYLDVYEHFRRRSRCPESVNPLTMLSALTRWCAHDDIEVLVRDVLQLLSPSSVLPCITACLMGIEHDGKLLHKKHFGKHVSWCCCCIHRTTTW